MKLNRIHTFTKSQMINQARRIVKWINENKKEIGAFGMFFVNGIMMHEPSRELLEREAAIRKSEQEEIDQKDSIQVKRTVPFYNWLES